MQTTITVTKSSTTTFDKMIVTLATDKLTATAANGDVYNLTIAPNNETVTAFMSYIHGLIIAL